MKTLDEVLKGYEICTQEQSCSLCPYIESHMNGKWACSLCNDCTHDAFRYLKEYRDTKNALNIEREKTIKAYCQWQDAKEKLEAQTIQKMWTDNHFQFEISDNPPLTWDELKVMTGKPVWIDSKWSGACWYLIESVFDDSLVCIGIYGERSPYYIDDDDWQAYRKERENENI